MQWSCFEWEECVPEGRCSQLRWFHDHGGCGPVRLNWSFAMPVHVDVENTCSKIAFSKIYLFKPQLSWHIQSTALSAPRQARSRDTFSQLWADRSRQYYQQLTLRTTIPQLTRGLFITTVKKFAMKKVPTGSSELFMSRQGEKYQQLD
jgi:hypothetical protein